MLPDVSDEHLVTKAQSGQKEAFLMLYDRYLKKVYNRVRSRVPAHDAEDVTQEVFIAVVRSINKFEGRSLFSTWLYTIVNRQIADYYRRSYRSNEKQGVSLDEHEGLNLAVDNINTEDMIIVQQALHKLPESYQEIILLRFTDGLSFSEIAEHLNKSLEATKSLYRRAIQTLCDKIGEHNRE